MSASCVNLPGHDKTNNDLSHPVSPQQCVRVTASLAMAWLQVCHLLAAHGKCLAMKKPRLLGLPYIFFKFILLCGSVIKQLQSKIPMYRNKIA